MRFPRPRLSELRCMKEPYIRNMFIKNAAAFLLSTFVGVVAVIASKTGAALLPVLFVALYFLVSAIGVAWNAAAGRYVVVRAAAVACEEQRDAVRQKRSVYRFIPVDEDGNYLSEQGAYDIFLDFASKKKSPRFNFFIGRTYENVRDVEKNLTRRWELQIGCASPAGTCWETGTARGARRKSGMRGSATGEGRHGRNKHSEWRAGPMPKAIASTRLCAA